jgi:putative ABC transport system permease protein
MVESIKLAFVALNANRARSILTMLGISIGVGAVIALLAIGTGVQNYVNDLFGNAGSNIIAINPGRLQRGGPPGGGGGQAVLTEGDYRAVAANTPNLVAHTAAFQSIGNFSYASIESQVTVYGVTPGFSQIRNWNATRGRFIEDADNGGRLRVVVLGTTLAKDLFPDSDPIDQTIRLNNVPFRVVGMMESKGSSFLGDQDAVAFIPLSTAQERVYQRQATARSGERIVSAILLQSTGDSARPAIERAVKETLRERHRLKDGVEDDFTIISQTELLNSLGAVTTVLTIFLGAIGAISLLVGGIGIMNIMLVSVTERTREIGLRKAIGAKRATILSQFLVEAVVLSLIGGALGIAIGVGLAIGIRYVVDFSPVVQFSAIGLAVGFSIFVGLFFGIYPAFRASRLNPIDALRYE